MVHLRPLQTDFVYLSNRPPTIKFYGPFRTVHRQILVVQAGLSSRWTPASKSVQEMGAKIWSVVHMDVWMDGPPQTAVFVCGGLGCMKDFHALQLWRIRLFDAKHSSMRRDPFYSVYFLILKLK